MSSTPSAKYCVICGHDCAGKPRTKDTHGNYYCTPCYGQRLEDVRQGRVSVTTPPAQPQQQASHEVFDPYGIDPNLIAQESVGPPHASVCPTCGMGMHPGTVICVHCGCDLRSGQPLQMRTMSAPRERTSAWPIVIGIISIVFGAGGLLFYCINALLGSEDLGGAPSTGDGAHDAGVAVGQAVGFAIGSLLPIALSVWLTLTGIGVLRRRRSAVGWMRGWAITKIVLCCLAATCLGIMAAVGANALEGRPEMQEGVAVVMTVVAVVIVWQLVWPIFVLAWFRRPTIKAEVAQW